MDEDVGRGEHWLPGTLQCASSSLGAIEWVACEDTPGEHVFR